ncbi:protection of telomeres protein 1 isoform X1 [Chiloscyllium plagiosum]|uniref:protection of telomeres protein 1 isoform X1 n=1 Tax=Chiloscyllium plagiosum TaxID=36176 RepID=UPI001CB81CBA|nr:protection of telomeres protein 1 isoform X1 [Chiloscyllium plagiosum]XP_043565069.1 protection of telomeres protein 1 isoform X1 [Chiloscyllium plagiosum]
MPFQQLKESDGLIETQLPSHMQRIEFDKLQLSSVYDDKYVEGTILMKYPSHELGTGEKAFKMVLEESTTRQPMSNLSTINTFVFGKLVDDCEHTLKQGDKVVLSKFLVRKSASASKDGRHVLQLELSEETGATVFVYAKSMKEPTAAHNVNLPIIERSKIRMHDYTYIPLNKVKGGITVNVYGVVKFFKPPYHSKGTDFCSTVTIVDPSNARLNCVLFSGNVDLLPKIHKMGDVVRFHRIKIQEFNKELQAINAPGFSALTFDGTPGAPLKPRTTSKSYQFTSTDQRTVEELRKWASADPSIHKPTIRLSEVKPAEYFDLTCQLIAKAEVDRSAVLLKVWDGTQCPHPLWQVPVDASALEGDPADIHRLRTLAVDVLVYDNHIGAANLLKVGMYLTIHNLHAKLITPTTEKPSISLDPVPEMGFHLHGGTSYGRGITIMPADCSAVQQLKQSLESALSADQDSLGDLSLLDILNTSKRPSASEATSAARIERCQQESATVLTAHQHIRTTPIQEILDQSPPQKYRIRAKLVNYEPRALHQSVKLYCPKCCSLQEIPNDDDIDTVLQGLYSPGSAAVDPDVRSHDAAWYKTAMWEAEGERQRRITVHLVRTGEEQSVPEHSTILVEGMSLNDLYRLSERFGRVIPTSSRTKCLSLNDLSIPFLIEDRKWHYGCKNCSDPQPVNVLQSLSQSGTWESSAIAKVLGVQLLSYVFVMKFTFDDGSGSLDAFLWNEAEGFFGISAADIMIDDVLQGKLTRIMDTLCPSRTNPDNGPWLECCVKSYYAGDGSEQKTYYQIFDTVVAETEDI